MATEKHVQKFIRLSSRGRGTAGAPLAPPELRPRLVTDAETQESNLTDVILGILAERYKVEYQPTGRKTTPTGEDSPVNLRIPQRLFQRVAAAAASRNRTVQRQILADLCEHYGLRLAAPPRQRRRRPRAATA